MSGIRIVIYRPGGPFWMITVGATLLVAMLLSAAAAAIVLVIASLFAAGVVLASALHGRRSGSSWPDRPPWPVDAATPLEPVAAIAGGAITSVAAPYRPLHAYLEHRHASHVVLTFEQIESLLGFSLPTPAWIEREWWTTQARDPDGHADAWTIAGRTATPNLLARTVAFTRLS